MYVYLHTDLTVYIISYHIRIHLGAARADNSHNNIRIKHTHSNSNSSSEKHTTTTTNNNNTNTAKHNHSTGLFPRLNPVCTSDTLSVLRGQTTFIGWSSNHFNNLHLRIPLEINSIQTTQLNTH